MSVLGRPLQIVGNVVAVNRQGDLIHGRCIKLRHCGWDQPIGYDTRLELNVLFFTQYLGRRPELAQELELF
jgi:hypothetical protein